MPVSFCRAACLIFVLVLSLAGLPALAQEAPPHEGEGARRPAAGAKAAPQKAPPRPAAAVQKKSAPAAAQKNALAAKDKTKPPLRSLDKNHDGRVTRDEYLSSSKKRFAKADANRDGMVSQQEAKAVKAALQEKQAKRDAKRLAEGKPVKRKKGGKSAKPYLSTYDKNKDGRLSQKEYLARREKSFAKLDLNHDGAVSRDEARLAKKQIEQRREERKAQAKARRLRKIEEAKLKAQQAGMSSPGPEFVGTVTPPPAAPAAAPTPPPASPNELPLTPIAPGVPAQPQPET